MQTLNRLLNTHTRIVLVMYVLFRSALIKSVGLVQLEHNHFVPQATTAGNESLFCNTEAAAAPRAVIKTDRPTECFPFCLSVTSSVTFYLTNRDRAREKPASKETPSTPCTGKRWRWFNVATAQTILFTLWRSLNADLHSSNTDLLLCT